MTLRIECPSCQQTFEVGEELKGRTVECGSCEKRFQVTDEVLAKGKERFYPDEVKKSADLSRFGRAPVVDNAMQFRTGKSNYSPTAKTNMVGPPPLTRTLAAVAGFVLLLLGLSLFYFGSWQYGALLQDIETQERLILGGFIGGLGFFLLVWGRLRGRGLAAVFGLAAFGGILALAFLMPVYRTPDGGALQADGDGELDPTRPRPPSSFLVEETLTIEQVVKRTRWAVTVQPAMATGDESQVAGVWVRGMEEFQSLQLQSYLSESFALPVRPDFRLLNDGGIFLLSGVPLDLDQVGAVVARFGEVEQVIPELRVVQVTLDRTALGESSSEITSKLNNPSDGAFYSLNFQELKALEQIRVKAAINRLRMVEPLQMRKDITARLVSLMGQPQDPETYGNIAAALEVWSEPGDGADQVISQIALKMRSRGEEIPVGLLSFLVSRQTNSAAALIAELWSEGPSTKKAMVEDFGSGAAPFIVTYLRSPEAAVARNAAMLLGQIGTDAELPAMREALTGNEDEDFQRVLQGAIKRVASK